jgi:hypothetical protein
VSQGRAPLSQPKVRKTLDTTDPAHWSPVARAWSHRKSIAPSARARRITACDFEGILKSTCKEIALQKTKNRQIRLLEGDYIKAPVDSREKERLALTNVLADPMPAAFFGAALPSATRFKTRQAKACWR